MHLPYAFSLNSSPKIHKQATMFLDEQCTPVTDSFFLRNRVIRENSILFRYYEIILSKWSLPRWLSIISFSTRADPVLIASELSGFTCTSSLTMNAKFQYRTEPRSAVLKTSSRSHGVLTVMR